MLGPMYPIDILLDEHKLVERVIDLVEQIRDRLKEEKEVPATVFWKLVDFLYNYSDVIHHSKEEDVLFAKMQDYAEKLPTAVKDQIAVLIDQHLQGLDLANEMHKAIRDYKRGSAGARKRILQAVTSYVELMKPHFQSEEDDVFPAMVKVLSKADKDQMKADFDRFDRLVGGAEAHKRYERVVSELEKELR
jgi:hemerythrin-like domain-containing protein